jgi:hypothetical protein
MGSYENDDRSEIPSKTTINSSRSCHSEHAASTALLYAVRLFDLENSIVVVMVVTSKCRSPAKHVRNVSVVD